VLFGLNGSRLGDGAADSPIVETRYQSVLYLGYGWTF
jgi:outer membrane scaffolding protein for murein synthesis (MipA/OmpV family)